VRCSDVKATAALFICWTAVGAIWVVSKPGGLNIKEWLQPRNCAPVVKSLYGGGGKADLVFAWGRPMFLWEVTGACTIEAHRGRGPGTQGRTCRDNVGKDHLPAGAGGNL
jgi:hypothetical protein